MTWGDNEGAFWNAGDQVVFESVALGRTLSALATTVVEDGEDLTVLYLAIGAETTRLWQSTGEPIPRVVSAAEFAEMRLIATRGTWTGHHMMMLARPNAAHAIFLRWTDLDWSFLGWYVNLQDPLRRTGMGFAMRDQFLDVVVDPHLNWHWKDEDELEEATSAGRLTMAEAKAFRLEGERVIADIEGRRWPFDAGYEHWRPDRAWPLPALPKDWNIG